MVSLCRCVVGSAMITDRGSLKKVPSGLLILDYKGVLSHQQKEENGVSVIVTCLWPPCVTALKFESSCVCPGLGSDQRTETHSEFIIPLGCLVYYNRALLQDAGTPALGSQVLEDLKSLAGVMIKK